MLTLNERFATAMKQHNPQVRFKVAIHTDASTVHTAIDGPVNFAPPTTNLLTSNQATGTDTSSATTGFTALLGAAITSSTAIAWRGSRSLRVVTDATGTDREGVRTDSVNADALTTYAGSVYVYATTAVSVRAFLFDGTNTIVGTVVTITTTAGAWTRIETAVTTGALAVTSLQMHIQEGTVDSGITFYLDGLQIEKGSTPTPWVDGTRAEGRNYAQSVATVEPFAAKVDLVKRTATISETTVTFTGDGWARDLVINNRLLGKKVVIEIGDASIYEEDFEPFFAGIISRSPIVRPDNTVEIEIMNGMAVLRDTKISGYWHADQPLQAIEDVMDRAKVPADLIDSPSLDPASYTATSHHVCTRTFGNLATRDLVVRDKSALAILNQLAVLVDGLFVDGEDGQLRFVLYDSTAAVSDTWTDDDILEIEPPDDADSNVINDVTVRFFYIGSDNYFASHNTKDENSIAAFTYPGAAEDATRAEVVNTVWLTASTRLASAAGFGSLDDGTVDGVGATFEAWGGLFHSMCGARWDDAPGTPQSADAKLSDARLAILKIEDEFIIVDRLTLGYSKSTSVVDPQTGVLTPLTFPYSGTYRIKERGALGSVAVAHPAPTSAPHIIYDYTVAVAMAQARVGRWAYGAPPLKVRTRLEKYANQLGDMISLVTDRYAAYGDDGLDANTKWQVTAKEVDVYNDEPCINWELTWATKTTAPAVVETHAGLVDEDRSMFGVVASAVRRGETVNVHVGAGLVVSAGTGLNIEITAGVLSSTIYEEKYPAMTVPVEASSTNWIIADIDSGGIAVITGLEPTLDATQFLLSEVTTDGSSVTAVDNFDEYGSALATSTIYGGSILDGEITTTKVATRALGSIHLTESSDFKTSIFSNSSFGSWSKG